MNITFFLRGGILETVVMLNSWWSQRYRWTGGSRQAPVPDRQCCPLYHFFFRCHHCGFHTSNLRWLLCTGLLFAPQQSSAQAAASSSCCCLLACSLLCVLLSTTHYFLSSSTPHILPTDVPLPQPSRLLGCSSEHLSSGLAISRTLSCGHQAIEPYATCHFCDTPLM